MIIEKVFEFNQQTKEERVEIDVAKNDSFKGVVLLSGMNGGRVTTEIRVHAGGQAALYALALGQNDEQGSFRVDMVHLEPNTRANVQVKAVLDGQSKFNFNGLIKVKKEAQKTQSYLREDVLLLSKGAQSLGQPQLEIEANDVKASHGSTVGRIDDEQLFYLASRGIGAEEAKKLIIRGFIDSIINQAHASLPQYN